MAPDSIASSRTSWCKVGREGGEGVAVGQVWLAMRCTWATRGGCRLHCCCVPRPRFHLNPTCASGLVAGGDPTGTGNGGESIYGRPFKDEFHSRLKFNHRQALPHWMTTSVLSGTCSARPRPRLPALLFAAAGPQCAGSADLPPARRTPQGAGGVRQPQRARHQRQPVLPDAGPGRPLRPQVHHLWQGHGWVGWGQVMGGWLIRGSCVGGAWGAFVGERRVNQGESRGRVSQVVG